jgi:hypothetical protein
MTLNKLFAASLVVFFAGLPFFILADDVQPHLKADLPDYDETGRPLPPGVPRTVDTNGKTLNIKPQFTTPAFQKEALRLVVQEANVVAKELKLHDQLPITQSNIVEYFVGPFQYSYAYRRIGNITTKNYMYGAEAGDKFSIIVDTHEQEKCWKYFDKGYVWPISKINTNAAYQLATQWLAAVRMDVAGLNRDCRVSVTVDNAYVQAPAGKFVPIYWVSWVPTNCEGLSAASVRLFTPTKTLLDLKVDDQKYILRKPLVFTNLSELFPGAARIHTYYPPKTIQTIGPLPAN